jgi:hypothetical protein
MKVRDIIYEGKYANATETRQLSSFDDNSQPDDPKILIVDSNFDGVS